MSQPILLSFFSPSSLLLLSVFSFCDSAGSLVSLSLLRLPLAGENALDALSTLRSLRALRIEESEVLPTESLRALKSLSNLELVSLRQRPPHFPYVAPHFFPMYHRHFGVSLSGCAALDDRTGGFLLPMEAVQSVELSGTRSGDVTLLLLSSAFSALERLHMKSTLITDQVRDDSIYVCDHLMIMRAFPSRFGAPGHF